MALGVLACVLSIPCVAWSVEYPCPSDPGFCYRDFGNDGCFDAGTDDGPIDTEIEDSAQFPVPPPPGSIVCPPSVDELTGSGANIRLATEAASSISFYGTRINTANRFETLSGDEVLIGGPVFGGVGVSTIRGEGDVRLEGLFKLNTGGAFTSDLVLQSDSGDVIVGPKVSIKASDITMSAPAGDVTLLKRVAIQAKNSAIVSLSAGGDVTMTKPKFKSQQLLVSGGDVTILEKGSLKSSLIQIVATGSVVIDRFSVRSGAPGFLSPLAISGTKVTLGVEKNGHTPRSRIVYKGDQAIAISAAATIDIDNLVLKSNTDVKIETTGMTANLTGSKLVGVETQPTFEVEGGPGSTCDLTATVVTKATLTTSCDTVIGP